MKPWLGSFLTSGQLELGRVDSNHDTQSQSLMSYP
jgi:hypothetical protein